MTVLPPFMTRQQVEQARPERTSVDPFRPVGWLLEDEYSRNGRLEKTAVIFLASRECPLRCVMCDLWKSTYREPTPSGAIIRQIDQVLPLVGSASQIKLYNHGNFFDPAAVPPNDYPGIAERLSGFHTVVVENHPRFCGPRCAEFARLLPKNVTFEVAMGLEIAHDQWLRWLDKQMTVGDFHRASEWLTSQGIRVRAFVLLGLPGMRPAEGLHWTLRSVREAFLAGADVCSIIPLRSGNGILDRLAEQGWTWPRNLSLLEAVLFAALRERRGRVFADLWQIEQWQACDACRPARLENLRHMNTTQQPLEPIRCRCSPQLPL